jgi:rhodanese-related sulfurtransferase
MRFQASAALALAMALGACSPQAANDNAAETSVHAAKVVDLSVNQLSDKIAAGNVRLIDVRSDEEWAEGYIAGAEHIPIASFDPSKLDLSDGREIVLYCAKGGRSERAAKMLSGLTGEPAQHLVDGIVGWEESGKSLEIAQ